MKMPLLSHPSYPAGSSHIGKVIIACLLVSLFASFAMAAVDEKAKTNIASEGIRHFDLWEIRVEGNTVLDDRLIETAIYPFLGPDRSLDDIEKARGALEHSYQEKGYQGALVTIPEQTIEEGVVHLKVLEGVIERVSVKGSRYFSQGHIKEKVASLQEGKPLNVIEAQKDLAKLDAESPDRKVTPVMRAGTTPGTIDIDLDVEDELPLHGSSELNARNSINTTRLRLPIMLRYDNLWQLNHSASLQYQVSPEDPSNVQVWSGTYVMPVESLNARLAFYGIGLDSSSDVTSAGSMNVVGNGNIFGLRLNCPISESRDLLHSVSFGWDYKDFGQSLTPQGSDSSQSVTTPVTYSPFQLGYNASLFAADGSLSQLNAELNFNFAGMGSSYSQFAARRYQANPNYIYLASQFRHRQTLPEDFALQLRLNGQITGSPLISNEQISAGGMLSVRGYHEVERLGDQGVVGSVELWSPDFGEYAWDGNEYLDDLRFLGFTDAAQLWIIHALPSQASNYALWSAGTGFRLRAFRQMFGEFFWEYPFLPTEYVKAGQQRIDFRVAYEF